MIDFSLHLPVVLDHVQLLAQLQGTPWTTADRKSLADWCNSMLEWIGRHPYGRQEENAANNHATYYDRITAGLALFTNHAEAAISQLDKTRKRIGMQIEPDGSMPHELRRTCSFSYMLMNVRGFVDLAWIGRRLGVDLWEPDGSDGRSIQAAVDFMYRHACAKEPWPFQQIEPIDWRMIWPVLEKAAVISGRRYTFSDIAHRMPESFVPVSFPMIEPIHPFGNERSPAASK